MEQLQTVLNQLFPASFQFICARGSDPLATIEGLQDNLQKITIENNDAGRLVDIVSFNLTTYAEPAKNLRVVNGNGQSQIEIIYLATAVIKLTQVNRLPIASELMSSDLIDPYIDRDLTDLG